MEPSTRVSEASGQPAVRVAGVVIVACATSAGAHAALVPAHMRDHRPLGLAFVTATAVLLAVVVALTARPASRTTGHLAVVLLASLISAYALSVTTGIPRVAETPEPVDAVGLATKSVEALGLAFALRLNAATGGRRSPNHKEARR